MPNITNEEKMRVVCEALEPLATLSEPQYVSGFSIRWWRKCYSTEKGDYWDHRDLREDGNAMRLLKELPVYTRVSHLRGSWAVMLASIDVADIGAADLNQAILDAAYELALKGELHVSVRS